MYLLVATSYALYIFPLNSIAYLALGNERIRIEMVNGSILVFNKQDINKLEIINTIGLEKEVKEWKK